jgi:hypothetical protein
VKGAIAYGAHTGATTFLGWPENTVLPLPHTNPVMILGGKQDGVIAASNFRYTGDAKPQTEDSYKRLERTFNESLADNNGKSLLVILEHANHFTLCDPADVTTGRHFLDWPETAPGNESRELISRLISEFIKGNVLNHTSQQHTLDQTLQEKGIAIIARR